MRVALAFAALLIAGGALLVSERRAVTQYLLLRELSEAGFPAATLLVADVDDKELVVRDLRSGSGDLDAALIEARYSPQGLLQGRLEELRIEGLELRATLLGGSLQLGALASPSAEESSPASPPAPLRVPLLPVERLEVRQARLQVETAAGSREAHFDIEMDAQGEAQLSLRTDLLDALAPALGLERGSLELDGRVTARPERLAIEFDHVPGPLHFAAFDIEARDLALELALDPETRAPQGKLLAGQLRDLRPEPRFRPLALELDFEPGESGLDFEATLREEEQAVRLFAQGSHDLSSGAGSARVHLDPVVFTEEGRAPGDVLPSLAGLIPRATGSIEGHGELHWSDAGVEGFVDFGIQELALDAGGARAEQMNTVVRVEGPWPPRIPRGQLLSMARIDFGLELTGGVVSYGVGQDGVLQLDTASWSFAGGTVRTSGSIDLFAREKEILLSLEDVDLAQLLELVNLEGLSGEGRLSGRIPLTLAQGSIRIRKAQLESTPAGGWIRYRPEGKAAALGMVGEATVGDLLKALADFHFERLALGIDGDAAEALVVSISLAGANPAHRDGQPYNLNLNVDGRLADLVRQATSAYHIPARIQEKLSEIAEQRP